MRLSVSRVPLYSIGDISVVLWPYRNCLWMGFHLFARAKSEIGKSDKLFSQFSRPSVLLQDFGEFLVGSEQAFTGRRTAAWNEPREFSEYVMVCLLFVFKFWRSVGIIIHLRE